MSVKQLRKNSNIKDGSIADTKLFSVLSQFSVYELNRLKKFVNSPYFNINETVTRLLQATELLARSTTADQTSKSALWAYATSLEEYDDVKFRKLCSDLLKLIERFLIQEEFEKNELQRAEYLLETIHKKQLKVLYKSAIRSAERLSDQYYFRPASFYYFKYAFERNYYTLTDYEIARSEASNVEAIVENLDKFYLAEKLRYYCRVISRRRIGSHNYKLLFIDQIIEHIEHENYTDIVPINFYYQIYLMSLSPDEESHYIKLKAIINEQIRLLPELEANEIMYSAYNHCIWNVNRGREEYIREMFELYKVSVRYELIYVNGMLDPFYFRNIIVSGLRLGEYDWVEDFIHKYSDRIDEKYRINAVNFNLANLFFYRKDYNKVIELLQAVEYEDPSYNLNSKTILIATYYELKEIDLLTSQLSSFETYLRRNKEIPETRKRHYLHLILFTRTLVRILPSDEVALQRLRNKVIATDGVVNKTWLLEKIDALLK